MLVVGIVGAFELRPTELDFLRSKGTPSDGDGALLEPPPFDEDDGPGAESAGVVWVERFAEPE